MIKMGNKNLISTALIPVENIKGEFSLYSAMKSSNYWEGKERYFLSLQKNLLMKFNLCVLKNDMYDDKREMWQGGSIPIISSIMKLIPKYIPERYTPKYTAKKIYVLQYVCKQADRMKVFHSEKKARTFLKGKKYSELKLYEGRLDIFTFKESIISLLEQMPYDNRDRYNYKFIVAFFKELTKQQGTPFDEYISAWAKRLLGEVK